NARHEFQYARQELRAEELGARSDDTAAQRRDKYVRRQCSHTAQSGAGVASQTRKPPDRSKHAGSAGDLQPPDRDVALITAEELIRSLAIQHHFKARGARRAHDAVLEIHRRTEYGLTLRANAFVDLTYKLIRARRHGVPG